MNKMIILNTPPDGINKKKVAAAIGMVVAFLLLVKVLGAAYYSEKPQPVQESSTYVQSETRADDIVKKENRKEEAAFYSSYRMEREKNRGKQIDALNELINSQENEQQARVIAANRLVKITEDMETEMKAEQILKSKGYKDCVVIRQGGIATAVIQSSSLGAEEIIELKETLGELTECKTDSVSIIVNSGEK